MSLERMAPQHAGNLIRRVVAGRKPMSIGRLAGFAVAVALGIAALYPVWLLIVNSIATETSLVRDGYLLLPQHLSFLAYTSIFDTGTVPESYFVTIFFTVIGTLLSLIITCLTAYPLSSRQLKNRNFIAFFFYFTMLFSGGLVPTYILITEYLHLMNSIWVYIVPSLLNVWNMFVMMNYFRSIPTELYEAARCEGASELRILIRIVLPLSLPAIATIGLFYAVAYWGEWQQAALYITDSNLWSLQFLILNLIDNIAIAQQIAQAGYASVSSTVALAPSETVRLATAVVTMGPIVVLFPFLQRYFVSGLTVGAIKG